jgi:hypothetical protein
LQIAVLAIMTTQAARPQSSRLGQSCDLGLLGATDTASFVAFHNELRAAISKEDAAAMAFLVRYPLRINDDHGSFYLNDAASLQSRFQEVFPPAVRAVILAERSQSISCSFRGVMYGTGTVWVNPTKLSYAIWAINLPQVRESARPSIDKIVFPCETDKQRLVIDIEASGAPRLRAWNKPRSVTDEPDIQISKGGRRAENPSLIRR